MAKTTFLDFEQPIAELEAKIDELRFVQDDSAVDISEEIDRLQKKSQALTEGDLRASFRRGRCRSWRAIRSGRTRSTTSTTSSPTFTSCTATARSADDLSIVGGLARFNGQAVMLLGHQKGRDTKERALRNFGMSKPEGYRKALRLMKLAEKFGLPVFTFVDTPGAYPGHRRRRARPVGGDRPQPVRDVAAAGADHHAPSSARADRAARWRSRSATRC